MDEEMVRERYLGGSREGGVGRGCGGGGREGWREGRGWREVGREVDERMGRGTRRGSGRE